MAIYPPPADILDLLNQLTFLVEQGSRESIQLICSNLTIVATLGDHPEVAQQYIDLVDRALDTVEPDTNSFRGCLRALRKACGLTRLLPSAYFLSAGSHRFPGLPEAQGGYADVWKGMHNGALVAIKDLRTTARDDEATVKKKVCKEVVIWKRLSHMHSNIVPFLGVTSTYPPSMVSQWMVHGDMTEYVRLHPGVDRPPLLMDICNGLKFLHSFDIVHGDLKGPNILIDSDGRARLADFGVTSIISNLNSVNASTVGSRPRGTWRWMAPELLDPDFVDLPVIKPSTKSDIYALAMVVIELFTGKAPFPELKDSMIVVRVLRGRRPQRPQVSDSIWGVVEMCWQENREARPTIDVVLSRLRENV